MSRTGDSTSRKAKGEPAVVEEHFSITERTHLLRSMQEQSDPKAIRSVVSCYNLQRSLFTSTNKYCICMYTSNFACNVF